MWIYMGARWTEGDLVRVTADDLSWTAFGMVKSAAGRSIEIKFYDVIEFEPRTEQEIRVGQWLVRNGGLIRKWYITDTVTGQDLRDGLSTMVAAITYINDQNRANGRR